MMNSFGQKFKITIWGASHSASLGIRIDGVPAGVALRAEDFAADLARRKSGAYGTTTRTESDCPRIDEGILDGLTTGGTIAIEFQNNNIRPDHYAAFVAHPRPSHADFVAIRRYGEESLGSGGGSFSGRMTLPLTAAGVVAKKLLPECQFSTQIVQIGTTRDPQHFAEQVAAAKESGDSVGGIVECRVSRVAIGLGEPFFDSVESTLSHLLFSIPAVKGVEFGSGFAGAALRGSENNDPIIAADGTTLTNNAGGINGGLTNGNDIIFRVAIKPTPSISRPQQTYNLRHRQIEPLTIVGRHDCCIALRAAVVVEAAAAIVLADLKLRLQDE